MKRSCFGIKYLFSLPQTRLEMSQLPVEYFCFLSAQMLKLCHELWSVACQTCCLLNHHHRLQPKRKENLWHVQISTCLRKREYFILPTGKKTVIFPKACECFSWVDLNSLQHFWHLTTAETNPIFTRDLSPHPWIIFRSRRAFWRVWCYRRWQKRWPKL